MYINIFHQSRSFLLKFEFLRRKKNIQLSSFHFATCSPRFTHKRSKFTRQHTRFRSYRSARLKRERESRKRWIFREKKDESKMKFQRLAYKRVARLSTLSQQYQQRMDTPIGVRKLGLAGGSSGNAMTSAWRAAVCLRINALKENLRW